MKYTRCIDCTVEGRIEYDQSRKSIDMHETRRISFIVAVVSACFSCQILSLRLFG